MSEVAEQKMRRIPGLRAVLPTLFFTTPLLTIAVPRLTPFFLALLGIALIATALRRGADWRSLLRVDPALGAWLALSAYLFINATFAVGMAFGKAAQFLGVVVVVFASMRAAPSLDGQELRRSALGFAAGAACGAVFLLVELLSDGFVTRAAMNFIAVLKPHSAKHVAMHGGKVLRLNLSEFNQNAAMTIFTFWPGLLILTALKSIPRRIIVSALFAAALAVPIALSEHDSSQIALAISPIVFALAWVWRHAVARGLAILWCVCFVLVIPLDLFAYNQGLHQATWLPDSARARIIIWQYTAEHALEHPWLGVGVNSTPAVKAQMKGKEDWPEGFVFKRSTGQHAHDFFLQSWYELGAIGALLAAIAGALAALRIGALPFLAQPFGAASFTVFLAIAAFAWSMWQTWFMCGIGLLPIFLAMAANAVERSRDAAGRSRSHEVKKSH